LVEGGHAVLWLQPVDTSEQREQRRRGQRQLQRSPPHGMHEHLDFLDGEAATAPGKKAPPNWLAGFCQKKSRLSCWLLRDDGDRPSYY